MYCNIISSHCYYYTQVKFRQLFATWWYLRDEMKSKNKSREKRINFIFIEIKRKTVERTTRFYLSYLIPFEWYFIYFIIFYLNGIKKGWKIGYEQQRERKRENDIGGNVKRKVGKSLENIGGTLMENHPNCTREQEYIYIRRFKYIAFIQLERWRGDNLIKKGRIFSHFISKCLFIFAFWTIVIIYIENHVFRYYYHYFKRYTLIQDVYYFKSKLQVISSRRNKITSCNKFDWIIHTIHGYYHWFQK